MKDSQYNCLGIWKKTLAFVNPSVWPLHIAEAVMTDPFLFLLISWVRMSSAMLTVCFKQDGSWDKTAFCEPFQRESNFEMGLHLLEIIWWAWLLQTKDVIWGVNCAKSRVQFSEYTRGGWRVSQITDILPDKRRCYAEKRIKPLSKTAKGIKKLIYCSGVWWPVQFES